MATIHLLQDEVINKIAAGEVVERPASVIKELVENSLDAGATEIEVELQQGGTTAITISDNGSGIPPEEALLAVMRHATSKLSAADDLFAIHSFGFRGEALAAIAAVSQFTLMSRRAGHEGFCLRFDTAGQALVEPWYGSIGTVIKVEELFYNIPARRKFLKSPTAEYAQGLEWVRGLALSTPTVGVQLRHNGKLQLAAPALEKGDDGLWIGESLLRQRFTQVLGTLEGPLVYVRAEGQYGSLEGLFSPPGVERALPKDMHLFVNRRAVKDRVLRYGILHGYQGHLLRGKYPVALAYLRLDPSLVDVNVHPAKTEVRFQYQKEIQDLVSMAIRDSLRHGDWAQAPNAFRDSALNTVWASTPVADMRPQFARRDPIVTAPENRAPEYRAPEYQAPAPPMQQSPTLIASTPPEPALTYAPAPTQPLDSTDTRRAHPFNWSELRHIGTLDRCFLLFEATHNLLVIDQHAFHERIVYERLLHREKGRVLSQPLAIPEAVTLHPAQAEYFQIQQNLFESIGLHYTFPAPDTLELIALPPLLMRRNLEQLVEGLADPEGIKQTSPDQEQLLHHVLATIACHSAVRAGEELSAADLSHLLREAEDVDFYLNCPHGRPVFKWWPKTAVQGWFQR